MKCKECNTINDSTNVVCDVCGSEIEVENNKLASASVLLGISGLILIPLLEALLYVFKSEVTEFSGSIMIVLFVIHILVAIAAILTGILAKMQIEKSDSKEAGNDIALTGIVLGTLSLLLLVICVVSFIKLLSSYTNFSNGKL